MTSKEQKRALISVSDKSNLDGFASILNDNKYEIVSTGGTYRFLCDRGIDCVRVDSLTHFPEILDGRVKTLHPNVFGGILFRRDKQEHVKDVENRNIGPVDLVVVNLYPFQETVRKRDDDIAECIENIDIGGPSLIRAAAKNYRDVTVVVDPEDYHNIGEQIEVNGTTDMRTRKKLATKAFGITSEYDYLIHRWFKNNGTEKSPWEDHLGMHFRKFTDLRYGENPHQKGALFSEINYEGVSIPNSDVLWGKELSYNNIYDIDAVLDILMEFPEKPACAIVKHNNPSGVALGRENQRSPMADAFQRALDSDSMSAFGGIIGLNRRCDLPTADKINSMFVEVVIAPDYDDDAMELLKSKKNLRIIRTNIPIKEGNSPEDRWVKVRGGVLLQTMKWPENDPEKWKIVTDVKPTMSQLEDMAFANKVVKHVKSNCVVLASDNATVGIGAGQMSRVDSCFMASKKAEGRSQGSVLSSDAFFPFRDGIDTAAEGGIKAISQPGGSIRDKEVIEACNEHGIAMVFTGVRLFKH